MRRERLRRFIPYLLIAAVLAGLIIQRAGLWQPVEALLSHAAAPLQKGISQLLAQVGALSQTARDLSQLRQRNEELEAENARLLLEIVRLREVEVEAALQRDLLNFAQSYPSFDIQGAHVIGLVIGRDPTNLQRTLTLDVGRKAGVARNMPVVTNRGLVGRISDVGDNWSRVLLITDVSSTVNAITQSTRATGLLQGRPDGLPVMRDIPQSDTVSVGDTVFTSGLGGNLPRQILIGQITSVQRNDYDLYQTAVVQPTVDFYHLEMVLIITGFPIEEPK
ncbi:MAG: rod shape-determining protein MreC [Anaerolineae bacterium]|nr:rod shape-determining protein MreC [Anaerolineae bacterium]